MAGAGDIHSILHRGNPLLTDFSKPRFDATKKITRHYTTSFGAPREDSDSDGNEGNDRGQVEDPRARRLVQNAQERAVTEGGQRYIVEGPDEPILLAEVETRQGPGDVTRAEHAEAEGLPFARAERPLETSSESEAADILEALGLPEDDEIGICSESEAEPSATLLDLPKPVFVPRHERGPVSAPAAIVSECPAPIKSEPVPLRSLDAPIQVARTAQDDDTDTNTAEDLEAWKERERRRLEREYHLRTYREREHKALERRRCMDDAMREAENKIIDSLVPKEQKTAKMAFLQKYHHKGAFFQDLTQSGADELYLRDYNEPIAEDLIDKSKLPAPLQLRRGYFGMSSQSKYTHLKAEDTTDFSAGWAKKSEINNKILKKRGGFKSEKIFDRKDL